MSAVSRLILGGIAATVFGCSQALAQAQGGTIAVMQATAPLELKDEEGATWQLSQKQGAATAVFGIPETDATSVAIVCKQGAAPVMEFFAAPTRNYGTAVTATLASGGQAYAQPTKANKERRLEATLGGPSAGLRQAMSGAEWVTITVGGKPAGRFLGLASSTPGRSFLKACAQFAGG